MDGAHRLWQKFPWSKRKVAIWRELPLIERSVDGLLMLTVFGLAEFERHLILSRTAEGRTRAQANGVRFGRKPSLTPYQRAEALRRREAGETLTEIARSMNVSHMTIARIANDAR